MFVAGEEELIVAEDEVGAVEDDVEVFAKMVGIAEEAEGDGDVALQSGGDGGSNGDGGIAMINVGGEFDGATSGEVEEHIEFVAAGVADVARGIAEGIVAPGAGEGLALLPVFGVMKLEGAEGSPATGIDFAFEGAVGGPEAALIADNERGGTRGFGETDEVEDVFTRIGERFFAKDGEIFREGRTDLVGVEMSGGGDDDAVEAGMGEGLVEICGREGLGEEFSAQGGGIFGEGIAEGGEFRAAVGEESLGMDATDLSAADEGEIEWGHLRERLHGVEEAGRWGEVNRMCILTQTSAGGKFENAWRFLLRVETDDFFELGTATAIIKCAVTKRETVAGPSRIRR